MSTPLPRFLVELMTRCLKSSPEDNYSCLITLVLTSQYLESFRIPSKDFFNYEGLQDREKVEEVVRGRESPPVVKEPQPDAWPALVSAI